MDNFFVLESGQRLEINFDITNKVKTLILEESGLADEQVLTDYLRVAIGHLFLDVTRENFVFKNEYEFIKRAFQTYMNKNYSTYSFVLS